MSELTDRVSAHDHAQRGGGGAFVLPPFGVDTAEVAEKWDRAWLDGERRLRLLPAAAFLAAPPAELRLWLHLRARYLLPTRELVEWLRGRIAGRSAIEVGAGNGDLGRLLGVRATDNYSQQFPGVRRLYHEMGQIPTSPTPDVERIGAEEAVRKYRPRVVIGAWVTRRFVPGRDMVGRAEANVYGPDEEALALGAETYIHVGSSAVHSGKTVLALPHEQHRFPWIVSRSNFRDPGANVIWVWERGEAKGDPCGLSR